MKRLTVAAALLRRHPTAFHVPPSPSTAPGGPSLSIFCSHSMSSAVAACASECDHGARGDKSPGKWLRLPPFEEVRETGAAKTTAVKWVLRCCPDLPRNLVHKLFRLRQVRKESNYESHATQVRNFQLARVIAKDPMNSGDRICLPITIKERPQTKKQEFECSSEEVNFVHGLVLHKDDAIVVVNKPPGMPVQGGTGIKRSLDELAITCLKYEYSEKPRLVHRLDRDCSGILVMGRTQASATYLHSLFREKTTAAMNKDPENRKSLLRRKYWALVIGSPRRPKGLISAPLAKVLIDEGKSDRIIVADSIENVSSNHAVTEYEVIGYNNGYSWLELSPLTGRKHQLRVHCAEVLRTPIVGDYKYGWRAHRKCKQLGSSKSNFEETSPDRLQREALPFRLDLESGSISDEEPRLHLHCKQILLPDVSSALKRMRSSSRQGSSELKIVELVAPLPPYMQKSLDILQQPQHTCEQSSMDRIVVALDFEKKLIQRSSFGCCSSTAFVGISKSPLPLLASKQSLLGSIDRGYDYYVVLMSGISPGKIALFKDSVDAWIQIACPRLSIDWRDSFHKPLLTPFEAEIALGYIPGWWERGVKTNRYRQETDNPECAKELCTNCSCRSNNGNVKDGEIGEIPMDYYAEDGGDWNSCYMKKSASAKPNRRNSVSTHAVTVGGKA